MIQKWAIFLLMLSGLSTLVACSSASNGSSTPAPTATLTASPTSFTAGQGGSTLTFTATNADSGSIDNGVGPVGINSHVSVTPAITTTYTYTATGPGGTATAQATVTVTPAGPAPTVTLAASPALIVAGQSVALTWTSVNATSIVIDNITSSSCSVPPCAVNPVSGGSVSASPTLTTTYTATATGNGQQTTAKTIVTVSPVTSFDGMPEPASAIGTKNANDVDPYGAVGTKQFMEYVNTQYQAFDKVTFQPVSQNGVSTPLSIGTPWNSLVPASPCADPGIQLDAVILFDRLAPPKGRWVIAAKATRTPNYYFCIAVSNTDDLSSPTLTWFAYDGDLTPFLTVITNGVPTVHQPDWPKLGTWTDSYYAAMDEIDVQIVNGTPQNTEVGVLACAFNRASMLNGVPQGTTGFYPMVCAPLPVVLDSSSGTYLGHSLIPADIDGTTPPPAGRDEFMVSIENPSISGGLTTSSTINLWDFPQVNWAASPPSLTLPTVTTPTVTTYTPGCYLFDISNPTITNCVLQPSAGSNPQYIDSVGDRLMPRFSYRNFSTYESFLVSHTVQTNLNPTQNPWQTGVRWYELRDNLSGTPSVYQSGTITPDDVLFRFVPTIAQDKDGNAVAGYSTSGVAENPGINFSYWSLGTPSAPTTEVTIINGLGEELTSAAPFAGEWGTYTGLTLDPSDDCTFWYVNEYWPTSAGWTTRIANFKLPNCN